MFSGYRLFRVGLVVLLAGAASACAWTPKEINLNAQPTGIDSSVGQNTPIFFRFIDDRDEIVVGHRGVATVGAKVTARRLPEYVEAQLREGLQRKQYQLVEDQAAARATVVYRLRAFKFYLEQGFFTGGENKSAAIGVDAQKAGLSYSNVYRFADEDRDIFIPGGDEIDREMNEALAYVLTAALADAELDKFLTAPVAGHTVSPAVPDASAQPTGGDYGAILANYSNEAVARSMWSDFVIRYPVLGSARPLVRPGEGAGGAPGYNLYAGGMSAEQASQACQIIQEAGDYCQPVAL